MSRLRRMMPKYPQEPKVMNEEKYITIKEFAELKGVSPRAIRLSKGKYIAREIKVKGG